MAQDQTEIRTFPELTTSRLKMKELCLHDAVELHRIWTDPRVLEYLVLDPFTELAQTQQMISLLQGLFPSGEGIRWAIAELPDEPILGTCGFHNWKKEHSRAELGYEIDSLHWRKGFMTEAISSALDYGCREMGLNRIEAFVTVGNRRSRAFLEKIGFSLEGTLRHYELARGQFQDQWIFSLLRDEWEAHSMLREI